MAESSPVSDALTEFTTSIVSFFHTLYSRFTRNLYNSFAEVGFTRWTKVILSVIGYILVRPYIERFFKYMHDRDRAKMKEKQKREKESWGTAGKGGKKAKASANSLRGGNGNRAVDDAGKVLGEVDNTDDELDHSTDDAEGEDEAAASGVPEFGRHARKRQKKYLKSLEKNQVPKAAELSDQQLLELLDWSESEGEKA